MAAPDRIPGGRADGRRARDFDPIQLLVGIGVELEHTNDLKLAMEIAMDHLDEIPDYYTRLVGMEIRAMRSVREHLEAGDRSGSRFKKLVRKLRKRSDVKDPNALAAYIGRKKYGKKKFAKMARS
jgi:hypothetical protein